MITDVLIDPLRYVLGVGCMWLVGVGCGAALVAWWYRGEANS
jgi:hypothetical protein